MKIQFGIILFGCECILKKVKDLLQIQLAPARDFFTVEKMRSYWVTIASHLSYLTARLPFWARINNIHPWMLYGIFLYVPESGKYSPYQHCIIT